jgi:hypothetical protein
MVGQRAIVPKRVYRLLWPWQSRQMQKTTSFYDDLWPYHGKPGSPPVYVCHSLVYKSNGAIFFEREKQDFPMHFVWMNGVCVILSCEGSNHI